MPQSLVGLLVKSVDFSNRALYANGGHSEMGRGGAFQVFFLQSLHACSSRSNKDFLMPFQMWGLNKLSL